MVWTAKGFVAALVWLVVAGAASAQEVLTPEGAIPNQYIVVLKDEQVGRAEVQATAEAMARSQGGRVMHRYEHALRGFAVNISATGAAALARNPRVRYVEQDSIMAIVGTQTEATWGLNRIDQREPLDSSLPSNYTYNATAAGVHAYIIDTGIRSTHEEFNGRMSNGYDAVGDTNGTNDCNGHGTHVAATVGGTTYGVAKQVTLHAVRVLNCSGSGSNSGVIAGVDWVTNNHQSPAVANMSLGGGLSNTLDQAVQNSIKSGVTYAIAAGNSNTSACSSSPARVAEALTVGSSTSGDARSSFSNFGTCVDLFAPGSSIMSAWNTSDTATNTISGTSMASPHVAGVAALYLAENTEASPATVHLAVVNSATVNKLSSIGTGSPNRLLYSLFDGGPTDTPPTARFTYSCIEVERECTFDGTTSSDVEGIISYAWDFGDTHGKTGEAVVVHKYDSNGTFAVSLTVTDTASQTDTETKSVTVSGGGDPCTGCKEYVGALSGTRDFDYQPGGTYYYSSVSGTHRGWLQGPSNADFDLYLQRWNGFAWTTVARSESATSEEQIAFISGTPGYYRWRVFSYSGSGTYTFWLQRP
jgi:serine protease